MIEVEGSQRKVEKIEQIELEKVSFSYPENPAVQIFDNVSCKFGKGRIGVIGKSSSGKSTLLQIMLGLYPVQKGQISIDNYDGDLKVKDGAEFRRSVCYFSQSLFIFNGTVRENLLFAKPDATQTQLLQAVRRANFYD